MSKILRLEGLGSNASAEDIRTFFDYLHIPEGGVYIVGGSLQEAFIAFKTERQGQLAMLHSGNLLKGFPVTLHSSSMDELELKLESVLKKKRKKKTTFQLPMNNTEPATALACANTPSPSHTTTNGSPSTACIVDPNAANMPTLKSDTQMDNSTAFILKMLTALKSLQSPDQIQEIDSVKTNGDSIVADKVESHGQNVNKEAGYVRLFGLPPTTTKEDICQFFHGLTVEEVIVNAKLEHKHACLVKFASTEDASDALRFNKETFGTAWVEVRGASERMWNDVLQECKIAEEQHFLQQDSVPKSVKHDDKRPLARLSKRSLKQSSVKPTKKFKPNCDLMTNSLPAVEHIIMVSNLPKTITKTDLKELFRCPNIPHKDVLHLLDKVSNRTDKAFLVFDNTEDFNYAVNLNGCHVGCAPIEVSSITKEKMREMMADSNPSYLKPFMKAGKKMNKFGSVNAAQTCMLMRNMPADVQKSEVHKLLYKFKTKDNDVTLLYDEDGSGIGEAVVQFRSAKLAALALRLHGKFFLGAHLLLTLITESQKENIILKYHQGH
ncbi:RNA binding motif protein 12Ba [Gouania willdenowi]|uniref:RNA binding motif protein 12Ba n=1 Tax=Gouania willdenowi TaxID=441366 RepID=UPI001054B244|nr:RNA-binding protein 12-like [Gouania willdenowi]